MNWSLEKRLRRQRKKGMIPVDIFDIPLTKDWLAFHEHQGVVLKKLRKRWVHKWMTAVRPLLDPVFVVYVWRFRLRKIIASELIAAWTAGRVKHIDQRLAAAKGVLQRVMAAHIWRRRFSKALVVMEPELFWKAYHRWHPEELQDELEEINNIFNIG
ncbi:hypothetical protein ON010_g8915 [Phytophthora cinnamomi]|nr:hypothetical protein ON010_g8915 [Phytophthora cinnamomi]